MKRIFAVSIAVAALALLVSILPPTIARAQQNSAVRLTLEAAYEGYYRTGQWLPMLVSVSNSGPSFNGVLRLSAPDVGNFPANNYNTPIDLPQQSSKQVFLYMPANEQSRQARVELISEDRIIASVTQDLKLMRDFDMLFAIVTESPRGTIDLKAIRSGMGDAYQANWRIDNIPRMSEALRGLDGLIFDDVDTGALSTEQRQAIEDWVIAGGHLVVTGGPNWQKTQAGISKLLPIQPTTTTTLTNLPAIAEFAGKPNANLQAASGSTIVTVQGTLTADARTLVAQSGVPLIVRHFVGGGLVDYVTVDPGLSPFDAWTDRGAFWFNLLETGAQSPSWSSGISTQNLGYGAANYVTGLRLPDVLQLMLFLGLYIVVIGPINYAILWRLKRREWAWLTIPLIVVVTAVIYYATGFSLRGSSAIVNRMAVVQVFPGSDRGKIDAIIGVLAPRRAVYDLTVDNGYTLRPISADDGAGGMLGPTTPISVFAGTNYEARGFPVDAGTTTAFTSSGYVDVKSIGGDATIILTEGSYARTQTRTNTSSRITGTVRNTTGMLLRDVVVLASGSSQVIGTLAPGETRNFQLVMDASGRYSPPVSLGNLGINMFSFGTGRNNRGLDPETTARQIMGQNYYADQRWGSAGRGLETSPERQELIRRIKLLRAIVVDQEPTGGRGTGVYVIAWTNESPLKVELKTGQYATEDTTMYVYQLPVEVKTSTTSGVVELPNPYITWTPTVDSMRREITPYEFSVQPADKLAFRFTPMPTMRFSEVVEMRVNLTPRDQTATRQLPRAIYLRNWGTGQWEKFDYPVTEYLLKIQQNVSRFLSPNNNSVEIMIQNNTTGTETLTFDSLDVTLYGRLAQ